MMFQDLFRLKPRVQIEILRNYYIEGCTIGDQVKLLYQEGTTLFHISKIVILMFELKFSMYFNVRDYLNEDLDKARRVDRVAFLLESYQVS